MNNNRPLCIYHGTCADGFSAAWVVWKYFKGDVDFHPGVYGEPPPDVCDRDVFLVDFSYKRSVIEKMSEEARSILILDHHKSTQQDLKDFQTTSQDYYEYLADRNVAEIYLFDESRGYVASVFDMNRSGCMITWDYFFPGREPPQLLKHIQDRDLWLFKLEGTKEIQANVFSYPYDFEVWDDLMSRDCVTLISDGVAIERYNTKTCNELLGITKRHMVIGGHDVPVANMPYTMASEAANFLSKGFPFAATYFDAPDGRHFSLRSSPDGMDVSEIAKLYGGGGHQHASAFIAKTGFEGDDS